jgi:hypothetical protein
MSLTLVSHSARHGSLQRAGSRRPWADPPLKGWVSLPRGADDFRGAA